MKIERFPAIEAILLDFDALLACGFSWPDYHSEVGLDAKRFEERPETIIVDFSGGAILTQDTPPATRARMQQYTARHEAEISGLFSTWPPVTPIDPLWKAQAMSLVTLEHCGFDYRQWEILLKNAGEPIPDWLRTLVVVTPERWTAACQALDLIDPAPAQP